MIDNFKSFIELALNKNQMGKPSSLEFNSAVAESELKIYTELFADFRKSNYKKARFQETSNYGNESGYNKQAMEFYISEANLLITDGVATMPEDLFLVNDIFSKTVSVEKVDLGIFNTLKRRNKSISTNCSPIYSYNDSILKVFPPQTDLEIIYFRNLKLPKWTYRINNNVADFDPSKNDFQDLDIHPLMIHKLFVDTLQLLGLNMQNEFALQYSQQMMQENMVNKQ